MFEIHGKYATAKVFADIVDNESISQVINMLNQPFAEGQTIRMMPDIHAGAGCTIGTTMTITDKVCPNLVGVDIGCGMHAVRLEEREIDFQMLDDVIRNSIPSGFAIHSSPLKAAEQIPFNELHCAGQCDLDRAKKSIGSLGGGNHYIEVDRDKDGALWIVIHSGSRHLGTEVASFYQAQAINELHTVHKESINSMIATMRAEGRQAEIQQAIADARPQYAHVPKELCWCEGRLLEDYMHDMKITQKFAAVNREAMADLIMLRMGLHPMDSLTTIHNYIDTTNLIIRKGAVAADRGQRLIIPMNMRDGALLCIGKGNPDWNYSAPHGAGRLMSRAKAKEQIALTDFQESMSGVWTTSVNSSTIDESPMAYKPIESIIGSIQDTVDIIDIIKPVYNFKAGL